MQPDPQRQPGDLYRQVGGALFARQALLLQDNESARRAADELFVRFVLRFGVEGARAHQDDTTGWLWIYRVATNDALQRLSDHDIPGGDGGGARTRARTSPPARRMVPSMEELRRLDELHANARVLCDLDGLSVDEVEQVLGPLPDRLRRNLEALHGAAKFAHPSRLQLDIARGSPAVAAHLQACPDCSRAASQTDEWKSDFAQSIGPEQLLLMSSTIAAATRAQGPRSRGVKQAVIVTVSLLAVCGLALFVARPRAPTRAEAPYGGLKGASRAKASGLQIYVRRDDATRALDPKVKVRAGDRLLFRVRVERPRFLEVRVRQGQEERRVFPADEAGGKTARAVASVLVNPGQYVDRDFLVTATSGTLVVVGRFADRAFPVDAAPPGPDVEVVPVRIGVSSTNTP